MYEKVSPELNFKQREREVLDFWQKNDIFQKSMTQRAGGPTYTFYD